MSENSYIYGKSDLVFLQDIGRFVKSKRMDMRLTQDELADKATMSRSTLSLLERGEGCTLSNLIKLLRILDALYVLSYFEVQKTPSPMQLAQEAQIEYQRVRKKKGEIADDFDTLYEW